MKIRIMLSIPMDIEIDAAGISSYAMTDTPDVPTGGTWRLGTSPFPPNAKQTDFTPPLTVNEEAFRKITDECKLPEMIEYVPAKEPTIKTTASAIADLVNEKVKLIVSTPAGATNKFAELVKSKRHVPEKGVIPKCWLWCPKCNKQKPPRWLKQGDKACFTCQKEEKENAPFKHPPLGVERTKEIEEYPEPAELTEPADPLMKDAKGKPTSFGWNRIRRVLIEQFGVQDKIFITGDIMALFDQTLKEAISNTRKLEFDGFLKCIERHPGHLTQWEII